LLRWGRGAILKNWRYPFLYDWLLLSSAISTQAAQLPYSRPVLTHIFSRCLIVAMRRLSLIMCLQLCNAQRAKKDYVRFKQATRLKLFLALRTDDKDYQKLCKRAGESLAVSSGRRMAGMWLAEIGIMAVSL